MAEDKEPLEGEERGNALEGNAGEIPEENISETDALTAGEQLAGGGRIVEVNITEQMKSAYIDYSMSVIVSRALPDVRDGLKPVHRRILYDMSNELGLYSDKPHRKSARIVGDVLGKFHPHGDGSVYDAMVRMAQEWSLRYPLVDGQGNFGSLDNDPPAAMRYTEARMRKIADEVMSDIEKDTIDFTLNFDDTLNEPTVLPTRVPLLLCNGASGIAVGMATNMAPHNLSEVVDACVAYIENPEMEVSGLLEYVKGPDFPTGGIIYGYEGVREALETGRGRVMMRAKTDIEHTASGREMIVITEIPYQVNKAELIKKIADLINEKKIEGISYVNDESDRKGMRIVIILKHDAVASVVLNTLYKMTAMQTSFVVNNIALVDGRPQLLNLKDMVREFVSHRHKVIVRRTRFELRKAEERLHIVNGLLIAQDNIDEVISIIRSSENTETAKLRLQERFGLTEIQSTEIVNMRLRALTGLERGKLQDEHDELERRIARYNEILGSEAEQYGVIKDELLEIKAKYGDALTSGSAEEFNPEDFYADEEMVITISRMGYIKRTPLTDYRTQARGGIGAKGSATRDEDFIEHLYVATMHNTMMLFTEKGRCYWLKVYNIPEGPRSAKGRAIQNLIQIEPDDKVRAYINVKKLDDKEYVNSNHIVMCTREGTIKKTLLEAYSRPRQNGVNAITIRESDQLLEAKLTSGSAEVMIASNAGKAIRFNESTVRPIGRTGAGVRGISLGKDEVVIGMICMEPEDGKDVLVLSEKGYGKRTDLDEYRITNRGGKGVKTINVTEKTGALISVQSVSDDDDLMIINRSGITIRTAVSGIRLAGRATQGVRIINLREGDEIASVVAVWLSPEPRKIRPSQKATQMPSRQVRQTTQAIRSDHLQHIKLYCNFDL